MLASLFRRAFFLEQWQVGWSRTTIEEFLSAPTQAKFNWIRPGTISETFADPFGLECADGLHIYAERLVQGQPRGTLVELTTHAPDAMRLRLAKPWHLSYPFIASDGGRRYVVPEQVAARHLAFYPLDDEGGIQEEPTTTIPLAVLDGTFLHHDGLWWLFAASADIDSGGGGLLLFHAEELTGPYTPHPGNPVVTDRRSARPAGRIISLGNRLLRPGQDSTVGYGDAITLNEIVELSTTRYAERMVQRIDPADLRGGFVGGSHHLDHTASYVLVDSKRTVFCWYAWWYKLCAWLGRRSA